MLRLLHTYVEKKTGSFSRLSHEDWRERRNALVHIKGKTDSALIEPLIRLMSDPYWAVRSLAIQCLAKFPPEDRILMALVDVINLDIHDSDNDDSVEQRIFILAIGALREYHHPLATETLRNLLNHDNGEITVEALKILALIADPDLMNHGANQLLDLLKNDNPKIVREAVRVLGKISGHETTELLLEMLYDEDSDVLRAVISALGDIGDEKATLPLLSMLGKKGNFFKSIHKAFFFKSIYKALGLIGDYRATLPLIEAFKENEAKIVPSVLTRKVLLQALGQIGDTRAVNFLHERLDEPSGRNIVYRALGLIGGEKAVSILLEHFAKRPKASRVFCSALGLSRHPKAYHAIVKSMESGIGKFHVLGLGLLGDDRSLHRVIELSESSDEKIREMAAMALAGFDQEHAKNRLNQLLKDESPDVQNWARRSLNPRRKHRYFMHRIY